MRNFICLTFFTLAFHGMSQELDWKENSNGVYLDAPFKVGIQTINVDAALEVDGALNANEFLLNGISILPWTATNGDLTYAHPVGIGLNPTSMLSVDGNILAKHVIVDLNVPGPDYVFEAGYDLMSLDSLYAYTHTYQHLPYLPPAQQMEEEGINVMENQMGILRSLEELVLHQVAMQKELTHEKAEQEKLSHQLNELTND